MNRERWLLVASILILAGLVIYYFRPGGAALSPRRKSTGSAVKPTSPKPVAQEVAPQRSQPGRGQIALVDEHTPWGRSPFLTEEEATRRKESGGFRVRVTLVGPPGSVATIDGRAVVAGDRIGEETVLEIRPDSVVLEKEGRQRILRVSEPFITIEVKEGKR